MILSIWRIIAYCLENTVNEPSDAPTPSRIGRLVDLCAIDLLIVFSITTFLSLLVTQHWLGDLLANLRIQQLIGIGITLMFCVARLRLKSMCFAVVLWGAHLPAMKNAWPGTSSNAAPSQETLTLTTINALSSNRQHDLIIHDIRAANPDVFAVLELGNELTTQLSTAFSDQSPYRVLRPSDTDNFGIGVFSKHAIEDVEVFTLNTTTTTIAITLIDQNVRIIATHPLPPMGAGLFQKRNEHFRQLSERINVFRHDNPETPVVILGDLNVTPWSPVLSDFTSRARLNRAIAGFSVTPTWYQYPTFATGLILDHILIDETLQCVSQRVGPDVGSDHRSLTVGIVRSQGE